MANEIKVTAKLVITNGNLSKTFNVNSRNRDQTTLGAHNPVIIVGTSEEVISAGDVATLGYVAFQNLDSTNYVDIGPESGGAMVPLIRLEAGDAAILRLKPGITIRAQANTASVKLEMLLLND